MDLSTIQQIIGSVGFPIVACGALFWQNYQQSVYHRQESEQMREAINELKVAILQLTTSLNSKEN